MAVSSTRFPEKSLVMAVAGRNDRNGNIADGRIAMANRNPDCAALPAAWALTLRDSIDPIASSAPEVREFCHQHRLEDEVETALRLAEEFLRAKSPRLALRNDPEEDFEWLSLRVDTPLTAGESVDAFDAYCEQWAKVVEPMKAGLIVLDYNFINGD